MGRRERNAKKARYWQRAIREAVHSGMSIREFLRRLRLKESEFYWWQRRLKAGREDRPLRTPGVHGSVASFALVSDAAGRQTPASSWCLATVADCASVRASNWNALTRYCQDGDLEIENNGAERSLRGVATGRRNWTFLGSDHGGRKAAVLSSFIATSKRLGIDPFAYLRDLFERIRSHPQCRLAEMLPDRWRAARQSATLS